MRVFDMFKDVVTVFNYCKDAGKWYPTVLKNVELQTKSGIIEKNSGVSSSDNALLFVHCKDDTVDSKKYLPPKAWQRSDDKENTVTFAEDDFFVVGEFFEIVNEENYIDSYFTHMSENYDYCYKITSVKRFRGIPHFEIGGV